jgi:murein L,D-transpeptidase YcbB/YkuD
VPARLVAAALACLAAAGSQAEPDPGQVTEMLRRACEMLSSVGREEVAGEWVLSSRLLPRLYARAGFRLLWPLEGGAEALLGEIAASEGDGLSPDDYHFEVIISTLERRRAGSDDVGAAVDADLLLTDALVRLVAHLRLGKLGPDAEPRWDLPERLDDRDSVEFIESILSGGQAEGRLADLRPAQPIYGRLKAALARYRIIAADSGWPSIGPGPVMGQGVTDTRVATVRRRLALTGDYLGPKSDSPTYDAAVMSAVQNFQRRHGLETDGLLGPMTRSALNRPVEDRIGEIRVNLERARQLLAGVRGRFVLIDPAGGQVIAASDSNPIDIQPAEFDAEYASESPFRSSLEYVVINPDWTLPTSLVQRQVAPLARRSPARLEEAGISVFTPDGRRLDPRRADWSRPATLVVRQAPGEGSFLGSARLAFPNDAGISLHGRGGDALAGIVSVPDPLALAAAVLGADYSRTLLDEIVASGRSRTLMAAAPVSVIFAPWTAWAATDGSVSFRGGFEAADRAVIEGLAARAR